MHPEKLGISACDLESLQRDRTTQTSSASIDKIFKPPSSSSRPPLPRDISKSDKGSITVFEFCQIVQDPDSPQDVTLIKETVTEETKPHHSTDKDNKSSTSIEEYTANRYKYCREVIKPYLKHSVDCVESEEELLKNALDSVSEDFPDYQPCFEVFDGEQDISDRSTAHNSTRSSISTVDASTSTSCTSTSRNSIMEENNEKRKCVSKTKSSDRVSPKCPIPVEQCKEPVADDPPQSKCPKKKPCSPKPSSVALCDSCDKEPAIGVKCKNPSYYLTERCKDTDSLPNIPAEPEDSIIDNHKKTISTIKVAMEDFVDKVYKTTKDAVTLITTESAKQIDKVKLKTTESSNTDGPKKCSDTKGSETLTSFNFFRKVDSTDTQEIGSGSKPELPSISDVIGNIISKVDSTLSTLSDHMSLDSLPEALKPRSFNDTSSTYDNPSPPKEVANILVPTSTPVPVPVPVPTSNSVFATIKDKIVSMFRDEEPKPTESASRSSTVSSSSSYSDTKNEESEDLIDKETFYTNQKISLTSFTSHVTIKHSKMSDQPCGNCKKEKNKCLPCLVNPSTMPELQDPKPQDSGSCNCSKKPCCKTDDSKN